MRRECRRAALNLAMLLSAAGLLAASPQAKPEAAPAAAENPISAALCGRGKASLEERAKALDKLDFVALPTIWSSVEIETVRRWLEAPLCRDPMEKETVLYTSRRRVLAQLGRRLKRAEVTERIGTHLTPFRVQPSSPEEWPSDLECGACAALRSSATRIEEIAFRWPVQESTKLGALLEAATQRENLVAGLCAAQPSRNARAEIERKFRYYSWTASAARLFEVAALFEKPEIGAECLGR